MFRKKTPTPPVEPKLVQEFTLPLLFSLLHLIIDRWADTPADQRELFAQLMADTNARAARAINNLPPEPQAACLTAPEGGGEIA